MTIKKKVLKHLKGDIKTFKEEAKEDRELIKALKDKKKDKENKKHEKKEERKDKKQEPEKKIKKVLREFTRGELHSGSKSGPIVKNKKQALAIGYSEARRAKKNKK